MNYIMILNGLKWKYLLHNGQIKCLLKILKCHLWDNIIMVLLLNNIEINLELLWQFY